VDGWRNGEMGWHSVGVMTLCQVAGGRAGNRERVASGHPRTTTPPTPPGTPHPTTLTTIAYMATRRATHAGSWYTDNGQLLSQQLDAWLDAVPSSTTPIGSASAQRGDVALPTPHARAIIAPYAT
jgi:hypothetical protein